MGWRSSSGDRSDGEPLVGCRGAGATGVTSSASSSALFSEVCASFKLLPEDSFESALAVVLRGRGTGEGCVELLLLLLSSSNFFGLRSRGVGVLNGAGFSEASSECPLTDGMSLAAMPRPYLACSVPGVAISPGVEAVSLTQPPGIVGRNGFGWLGSGICSLLYLAGMSSCAGAVFFCSIVGPACSDVRVASADAASNTGLGVASAGASGCFGDSLMNPPPPKKSDPNPDMRVRSGSFGLVENRLPTSGASDDGGCCNVGSEASEGSGSCFVSMALDVSAARSPDLFASDVADALGFTMSPSKPYSLFLSSTVARGCKARLPSPLGRGEDLCSPSLESSRSAPLAFRLPLLSRLGRFVESLDRRSLSFSASIRLYISDGLMTLG